MLKSQTKLSFVHMNVSWTTRLTLKWLISVLKMLLPLSATDHVKYLGVLLDSNLSWKFHINNVALKVSRTVGVVARLRRFFPHINLLNIYQSLILPYLTYGLAAWGQAAKLPIYKIFSCFKNESFVWGIFLKPRRHALPLFICSKILPLQILYAEKGSSIMFDVSCLNALSNICDFFTQANSKHKHETRFSSSGSYVQSSRLNQNRGSFSKFGAKPWNTISNKFRQLSQGASKKVFSWLITLDNGSRGWFCWSAHSAAKYRKFCCHDIMLSVTINSFF